MPHGEGIEFGVACAPEGRTYAEGLGALFSTAQTPIAAKAGKASTHPPHRIGGAYCNPPFDQMLLIPRGTPIGVIFRSHTSPKLPTCLITL